MDMPSHPTPTPWLQVDMCERVAISAIGQLHQSGIDASTVAANLRMSRKLSAYDEPSRPGSRTSIDEGGQAPESRRSRGGRLSLCVDGIQTLQA
jgi:hypothetical protein